MPDPVRGESTIEAVLSIAPVASGDVILEVRGRGDRPAPGNVRNTWLVHVNMADLTCRDELDVQRSLKHVNPCGVGNTCQAGQACVEQVCMRTCGSCPAGFACSGGVCRIAGEVPMNFGLGAGTSSPNGRIAVMPDGSLMRWLAAANTLPAGLASYSVFGASGGAVSCDDFDVCTVDLFDSGTGLCLHQPISCADEDPCTVDSCTPGTGCIHSPIVRTEPGPAQFASSASLTWPATADTTHWNTYCGMIPGTLLGSRPAGSTYDQFCFESADAFNDGATTSSDATTPSAGTAYYYLVSGEAGCESAIGHASSGTEIPNNFPCPTPP